MKTMGKMSHKTTSADGGGRSRLKGDHVSLSTDQELKKKLWIIHKEEADMGPKGNMKVRVNTSGNTGGVGPRQRLKKSSTYLLSPVSATKKN